MATERTVPQEAGKAAAEWLGGDESWAEKLLADAYPPIRRQVLEELRSELSERLDDVELALGGRGHIEDLLNTLTEEEMLSVVKAVAQAERSRRAPLSMIQLQPWIEQQEAANRRLLAYVRTGDPECLETSDG